MNILVVYLYGKENKGDYAITRGLLNYLSTIPNTKVESITARGTLRSFCRTVVAVLYADLVISNGGYIFYTSKLNRRRRIAKIMFPWSCPLILARLLHRRYGFIGQSYGPLTGFVRVLTKWLFNGAKFIYTRESHSLQLVHDLGVSHEKCQRIEDLSTLDTLRQPHKAKLILQRYGLKPNMFLGVTVRRSTYASGSLTTEEYHRYLQHLAAVLDLWINHTCMPVILLPQTVSRSNDNENDLKCAIELKRLVADQTKCFIIRDDLPLEVFKPLCGLARVFLASRFHSLLFSISEGVPVVALDHQDFGPKTRGTMHDLGLNPFIFRIETLRPTLVFTTLLTAVRGDQLCLKKKDVMNV